MTTGRHDPLLPNAALVARREYGERVRSRLFHLSTILLAVLAVLVAFLPLFARAVDRPSTSVVGVAAADAALGQRTTTLVEAFLNATVGGAAEPPPFEFVLVSDSGIAVDRVAAGELDAAVVIDRRADGRLEFRLFTGETIPQDRVQLISTVGTFSAAILDWTARNAREGSQEFQPPSVETTAAAGPTAGGAPIGPAEYAGRRIVGVVLVVLIFVTLVIYGMWVAAGVLTEKTSRVMELMISAASARQLVVGKVAGIGLAGLTQALAILLPALVAIVIQDPLGRALFGPGPSVGPSLAGLSIGLLAAFVVYFVLGFVLYALLYAAAGSLVSRPEDLQMLALPLSLIAIVGYLQAVLALTGGSGGLIRFASYVPFWSPFVMVTRLAVGRVFAWELALSIGLLVVTIGATYLVAIRVYAAGVLLYGQRPGLRAILAAAAGR